MIYRSRPTALWVLAPLRTHIKYSDREWSLVLFIMRANIIDRNSIMGKLA